MIRTILLAGLAAGALGVSAHAQPAPSTQAFITAAAQSDEFERREGRLAEQRSHDHDVRAFAAEMVSAHTKTTQGLQAAIRKAGMPLPPPPTLSPAQARRLSDLSARNGGDFDRLYMNQQVQAHQEALGLVGGYAKGGPAGPIRDAAKATAPLVQHHLDMANALQHRLTTP